LSSTLVLPKKFNLGRMHINPLLPKIPLHFAENKNKK
jgi:hypothetical protein